jgi:hypothetical protein
MWPSESAGQRRAEAGWLDGDMAMCPRESEAPMPNALRPIRLLMAAGLFLEFVGFLYDEYWHAMHLSIVPSPPSEMLTIHGGIYVGELLVLAVAVIALARVPLRLPARLALWVVIAGGLVELAGVATDMWAHGHGYEKDLFHNLIYTGAGVTVAGYLLLELFTVWTRARTTDEQHEPEPELVESGASR